MNMNDIFKFWLKEYLLDYVAHNKLIESQQTNADSDYNAKEDMAIEREDSKIFRYIKKGDFYPTDITEMEEYLIDKYFLSNMLSINKAKEIIEQLDEEVS